MNISKDFRKYALDKGVSSLSMHYFEKNLETSVPEASLTPYI